ncbi:amidohydrolase family protein [Myxococcaceae bacterium GXIMD 01537]
MEGRLLLKNCAVFRADGRVRSGMAVVVEEGLIRRVAPDAEVPVLPGDWEVACRGRLVAPGLVDCHAHLVGGQLQPPTGDFLLRSSRFRLERRHRLAAALTASDVEVLTRFAAARALRDGITLVVDHLECPGDVAGALAAQARAAEQVGLRFVASHLSHSIDGAASAEAWVEANADFARARRQHPLVRGALGFHASYTCEDALLERLGELREACGAPVVFHLAEGEDDLASTYARFGRRVVPRLESLGLLGPHAIAAYARALDSAEVDRLAQTGTFAALSPRARLTGERQGEALEALLSRHHLVGLGTGGHGTLGDQLLAGLASVLQFARSGRLEPDPDSTLAQLLINGPAELCTRLFGLPSGGVEEGRIADLVVFDDVPAAEPETGHSPNLLSRLVRSRVAWTLVNGRVTVREGQLLGSDYVDLAAAASEALAGVWSRARVNG